MPLYIVSESYNGINSLYSNVGDWNSGEVKFSVRFSVGSGESNKIMWKKQGSNFWFQLQSGEFGDFGFLDGDTITVTYNFLSLPPAFQSQTFTFTVLYVAGNKMYVDQDFGITPPTGFTHIDGRQFPTNNYVSGILIVADRAPASVEFDFNLVKNGTFGINSLIDGELNRFNLDVVTGIPTGVAQAMTQLGNKSGGYIKNVFITLVASPGGGWRDYKITYDFIQWGFLQDGFSEPNYYINADNLAPLVEIKAFTQFGNPNGMQRTLSENTEANTGGFDENYNSGNTNYDIISTSWVDSLGNSIDAMNYSGESTFTSIISAQNQSNPQSTYRLGLVFRPIDGSFYKNLPLSLNENLLVIAPEVDFIADGVVDTTVYQGFTNSDGVRFDIKDISYTLSAGQVTVVGTIVPNTNAVLFFDNIPNGGRKMTLWTSIANYNLTGTLVDRVSLKLFDKDIIDAPILGVQIPDVISEILLDHGGNDITSSTTPNTTTEDDLLYKSDFRLIDGINYEGVRARIFAFNTVSSEEFTLEDIFLSFANVQNISGQFQPNITIDRGFNLPSTSDRNHISLKRKPSLDIAGKYGVELQYGFLNDWRYWLEKANVDNDFFDINEPNDGLNRDWQRFSADANWVIRISYYTRVDGVDDFNHYLEKIRPYHDDSNLSNVWNITDLSTGNTVLNFVANTLHEVTSTITWTGFAFNDAWAEITIEDFESGNRFILSTVLDRDNQSNPLEPISGLTRLEMNFISSNVAELKFNVNTDLISAENVCLSARIYSKDTASPVPYIVMNAKDAILAFSVRRVADPSLYPLNSPCLRVRRSSDNTEQDIGFLAGELDIAELSTFVGTTASDFGYVTKWYNQDPTAGVEAVQTDNSKQPMIIDTGNVVMSVNGFPALNFDGVNDYFNLVGVSVMSTQKFTESSVIERGVGVIVNNLGNTTNPNPYSLAWDFSGNIFSGMAHGGIKSIVNNLATNGKMHLFLVRNQLSAYQLILNNAPIGSGTFNNVATTKLSTIGFFPSPFGDFFTNALHQELIFWNKDKSSSYAEINSNTNAYYGNY